MKMSDSDLKQTSQMEYSQETSNVSQSKSFQTKQNIQKKTNVIVNQINYSRMLEVF
ncbi:37881_t:CDS:1, partial [Gigaspora margarita]